MNFYLILDKNVVVLVKGVSAPKLEFVLFAILVGCMLKGTCSAKKGIFYLSRSQIHSANSKK